MSCGEGITPIQDDGNGAGVLCPLAGTVFRLGSDDAAATLDERIESLYEHFHFLDLYKGGVNDFTDADAINEDHLAYPGGVKVTRALDSVLVKHLGK